MPMTLEILDTMNSIIREEKGTRVTIDNSLRDADLDSFGITMLFFELDEIKRSEATDKREHSGVGA